MKRLLITIVLFCLAVIPAWTYTEYTQGQTSSSFRGPVVFFNSTSSGALPISSSNPLPVSLPSSGSASNVNLTQYSSTAVGAANALHVQPGTGAIFSAAQSGTWNLTNISGTISLPTGASTAANQTTANTSLSSIDGKITACNTGAVTVSSSALPTGASTDANQTTVIGHVDGLEALLTTGNTNTGNIDTDTTTIIGHVDGIEALLGTIDTAVVTTIPGLVDQIEGYVDNIEGYVDGIEGLIDQIEGYVDGIEGYVDGIEGHLANLVKSINGPAAPTIDSYTQVAINLTTGADQVVVSSAPNKQIWVYGVEFTVGDADGQTVSWQDEDNVSITGIGEYARYGGFSSSPSGNFSQPMWKLGTDKDLEVDITGGDVDGYLVYAIVSI